MKQKNIYKYEGYDGKTRYAVCHWVERAAQFQAPLDTETRRLTGCHTEFARTARGIGGYASLRKARRRARKLYRYSKVTS